MKMYSTVFDELGRITLVSDSLPWYGRSADVYCCPAEIQRISVDMLRLDRQTEEYVYCFCLDTACHITGIYEVSHGTVNHSLLSSREVYQKAFMAGAVRIVLVHNHPSGDPTPSETDKMVTGKLEDAGDLIGITLADHIIIGTNSYYSFHDDEIFKETLI